MIRDLNIQAVVARSLAVAARAITVTDASGESFMVSLSPPTSSKSTDGSPRDRPAYLMRWRSGPLGPAVVPGAGWRVTLSRPLGPPSENTAYELLDSPTEFRLGASVQGAQAHVAPLGALYPLAATLTEQDGTVVGACPVAIWEDRETHAPTGTYEELHGEAPVDFARRLGDNRWLNVGGVRYRLTGSTVDFEGPRVRFTARVVS